MANELISLLEDAIKFYNEEIIEMNKNIRYLEPAYKQLVTRKRKKGVIKYDAMDDEAFNLFLEVLMYNNKILYNKILMLNEEGYRLDKMLEDSTLNWKDNMTLVSKLYSSAEYEKKEDEFYEKAKKIYIHACTYYVDLYDAIEMEKEETKSISKDYEYALKNIKSNNPLTTRNISSITNLINELMLTKKEKQILFDELNNYIKNTKKEKIINIPSKEEINKKEVRYVDNVNETDLTYEEDEEEDKYAYNYLITLKSFQSFNDINSFLNSIKYTCDINKVINNVISLLSESNEDSLLKLYLEKYIISIKEDEVIDNQIYGQNKEEINNTILYYGFQDCKNNILNDIKKSNIPNEYYDDIIDLINMIKTGNDKGKSKRITSIKKVLKLRYKDIRVTYKRLSNNVIIILGIFCKKDNKGYDVIDVTRKRNKELVKYENNIIDSINISELWNEYLKENSNIEEEILNSLASYTK